MSTYYNSSPAASLPILTPSTTIASGSFSNPTTTIISSSPLRQSTSTPSSSLPQPSTNTTSSFIFPRAYSFPPFFTHQPNSSTHHAQLQKWAALIQSYCRHHKIWKLSLVDALESDLFYNRKLGRRLSREDVKEALEFLRKDGRAEWLGKSETECWIWWRNIDEWATLLYDWVDETAQKNTVLTLYELTESDATLSQEFHGMEPDLLQKALAVLVKRGKAQVFGQEDGQGVKFF